jgi:transposase InsO family protein
LKGTGFIQPLRPHAHGHVDVSHLNICGTFCYPCSLLDGCSRAVIHWELRESMREADVEIILQRALEKYPEARPRIISDNGPQFIAKDFKEFIRIAGLSHVRTSPCYPQSNGKIERWHETLKADCIRRGTPLTPEDARRIIARFVEHYNTVRLHSAIGYVAPLDKLPGHGRPRPDGRDQAILTAREQKLQKAREQRKLNRNATPQHSLAAQPEVSNCR